MTLNWAIFSCDFFGFFFLPFHAHSFFSLRHMFVFYLHILRGLNNMTFREFSPYTKSLVELFSTSLISFFFWFKYPLVLPL